MLPLLCTLGTTVWALDKVYIGTRQGYWTLVENSKEVGSCAPHPLAIHSFEQGDHTTYIGVAVLQWSQLYIIYLYAYDCFNRWTVLSGCLLY